MDDAGGLSREKASSSIQGSVWAADDPPETAPSVLSLTAAAFFAVLATWLVFTVLIAISFLVGILTSEGLTAKAFFDRAESWVLVIILPIVAVIYLATIRAFTAWFANRDVSWPDAGVALAITGAAGALLQSSSLGPGLVSTLIGCLAVAAYLRWRAA
jgi:hypothetical protein